MSRSYDIDHQAEHAAACFDQMLAALKAIRADIRVCGLEGFYSDTKGAGLSGAIAEVDAAIAAAEGHSSPQPAESVPARMGYGVHLSEWSSTGGKRGRSWFVTRPDGERMLDDYGSERAAWTAASVDAAKLSAAKLRASSKRIAAAEGREG